MSYSEEYVPPGEDPYVVLRRFGSLFDLDRALMALGRAEIDARSADDHTMQSDPLLTNAIGGARLLVRESQLTRAQEVLDEVFGVPEEGAANELTRRIRMRMLIGLPVGVLFALFMGLLKDDAFTGLVSLVIFLGVLFLIALLTTGELDHGE